MKKENDDDDGGGTVVDSVESEIQAFAAKIGEETDRKYIVYIYRMVRNEETGKYDRPFIAKYTGIEPDPQLIADRFRGGKYLITFAWKRGKENMRKSYTLDVDKEAFPVAPKNNGSLMLTGLANNSSMSEPMQMQLAMMQTIGEVMKEAYRSGNASGGVNNNRIDPLDTFSGILESVESGYSRAMAIQSQIMERVFARSMENRFGLTNELQGPASAAPEEPASIIGQYAPIVKECIDGIKSVFSIFGNNVPKDVVKKVRSNDRFKKILSDPKALHVIGQALRREFGDVKARDIMKSFGVNMIIKAPLAMTKTPDIPVLASPAVPGTVKGNGKVLEKGGGTDHALKGKRDRKGSLVPV